MQFLIEVAILLFALGAAAVFGGFFHQLKEKSKDITTGMFQGALISLGGYLLVLLFGWLEYDAGMATQNWVMLIVLVVLAVIAWFFKNKSGSQVLAWFLAGLLSAAAIAIQFIWQIS